MTEARQFRFVHFADVHLGCRQYGLDERAADFTRAFESAVRYCLDTKPDLVVIAGDLFDSKATEPKFYADADLQLIALGAAGIPVVAIEGNHERWYRRGDRSWLWQLSRSGRLRLLAQSDPSASGMEWQPWTAERGFGAYTDVGPVRVFGVQYLGTRLRPLISGLVAAAAQAPSDGTTFRIGVVHTGVAEGSMLAHGGLAYEELAPLRQVADYLALGHIHHNYVMPPDDPWIFNPGSLEAHSMAEGEDAAPIGPGRVRGIYDVQVTLTDPPSFTPTFIEAGLVRRPFRRVRVDVTGAMTFEDLCARLDGALDSVSSSDEPPVLELILTGRLGFDRALLDQRALMEAIDARLHPMLTRITAQLESPSTGPGIDARRASREQIERDVFRRLIEESPYEAQREPLAETIAELKRAALDGEPVETQAAILEEVKSGPGAVTC